MATVSETELQRRLKRLENNTNDTNPLVHRVGDQYEYVENYIYVAYASALSGLTDGKITNQSDATDFQFSPYDSSGDLLTYRGYFVSKAIYSSGDPTDYTWEVTSGAVGFTSGDRYYTTSAGLESTLGNPTKPGTGITWTAITAGVAVPSTAVWTAERYTINDITTNWSITPYGAYVNTNLIADDAVTGAKISSSTTITAGTGNNVGVLSGVAAYCTNAAYTTESTCIAAGARWADYRIYAGHADPTLAPFRVKQDGTVIIESASSGSRLVLEDDTIKVYDGATLRVKLGNLA
jgi:hypothetical protein